MLPGFNTHANIIRFNPYFYRKKIVEDQENPAMIDLPYRLVFAVSTMDQIIIYSTQSVYPLAVVGNIHHATINDFAWNGNKRLVVCSKDGFCSVINFDGEGDSNLIGERLPNAELPEKFRADFEALD